MSVPHRPHRPRIVTLLILSVFFLGIWNAGRTLALARESRLMLALNVTLDPRIRLVIAFVWAVIFVGVAGAMWWKRPFIQRALPLTLTLYAITELILLLFAQTVNVQQLWLTGTCFLIFIIGTWWSLKRPFVKKYFQE